MNYNKISSATEPFSVKDCFLAIASRKLNNRERQTLLYLSKRKINKNATNTAKDIALNLKCAESTAWTLIRSLKSVGLLTYEDGSFSLKLSKPAQLFVKEKSD